MNWQPDFLVAVAQKEAYLGHTGFNALVLGGVIVLSVGIVIHFILETKA